MLAAALCFALLAFSASHPAFAQIPGLPHAKAAPAANPSPPDQMTPEAAREFVSRLSDEQARALLIQKYDAEAASHAESKPLPPRESLVQMVGQVAVALAIEIFDNVKRLPDIPGVLAASLERQLDGRPMSSAFRFLLFIGVSISAGLLAAGMVASQLKPATEVITQTNGNGLRQIIRILSKRFAFQFAVLLAFFVVASLTAFLFLNANANDLKTATLIITAAALAWLMWLLARFVFAPHQPKLRLCPVDDITARFLTNRVVAVASILAVGDALFRWTSHFGFDGARAGIGFWAVTIAYGLTAATIWSARNAITGMLLHACDDNPTTWVRIAKLWPALAISIIAAQWLLAATLVATGNEEKVSVAALHITLLLALFLPVLELAIRPLVAGLFPPPKSDSDIVLAAYEQTQRGMVRIVRAIAGIAIFFVLIRLWNIDVLRLAKQGVGERVAGSLFEIILLALLAYGLFEAVRIWTERQLAVEHARLRLEHAASDHDDLQTGGEGSRILTLFPLIRWTAQIFIVVFAALAMLGSLGINTGPLLAGAGIVGVAIGFGSQALVRDIISGIFFLADDAFRRGEYVEVGPVKGTVENISIRSMQLRHQNGPLNTIPFGEIKHLKNYSRDWVIMKLPLRLTFDTDIEKVRKLVKKLGQKMLEDPEIGPKFMEPLKCQGVIEMDDSAMIVRVKFMTKPGNQWPVRSKVYAEIRALFEREGIRFASREVRVRVTDRDDLDPETQRTIAGAAAQLALGQQQKTVTDETR